MPQLNWELHPGTGPFVLLVHGFLSSRAQWILNLPALAEFCQPVTVELWGHGRSPSPAEPDAYSPAHYVLQFEQIRESLGAENWALLGYSLGAGLTIRYALDHPERVTRHVFTNSTSATAKNTLSREWREGGRKAAENIISGGRDAMERIAVHPRHARKLPPAVLTPLLEDAELHDPLGIANTIRYTTPDVTVRAVVDRNTCPALLVCGTRERRFTEHRHYLEENMANLEVADMDVGHAVNMQDHSTFDRIVREFLTRA